LSACKTRDPQVGPYKGRMLNSGKCKLGDNPVRATESRQCERGPNAQQTGPHSEPPGSFSPDRGLCQLNTKGGVKLGDLCMLSVQNQSQHHSPVSGWHLTPTAVSLNSHCFKACVVFKQSLWFSLSYLPPQCEMHKLPCWWNYTKSGGKTVYSE